MFRFARNGKYLISLWMELTLEAFPSCLRLWSPNLALFSQTSAPSQIQLCKSISGAYPSRRSSLTSVRYSSTASRPPTPSLFKGDQLWWAGRLGRGSPLLVSTLQLRVYKYSGNHCGTFFWQASPVWLTALLQPPSPTKQFWIFWVFINRSLFRGVLILTFLESLGISREQVKILFKSPKRPNIFLQVISSL